MRVFCDGLYVVKFYVMGGMWRNLCDEWYVVRFYVMVGMW